MVDAETCVKSLGESPYQCSCGEPTAHPCYASQQIWSPAPPLLQVDRFPPPQSNVPPCTAVRCFPQRGGGTRCEAHRGRVAAAGAPRTYCLRGGPSLTSFRCILQSNREFVSSFAVLSIPRCKTLQDLTDTETDTACRHTIYLIETKTGSNQS